jgi:hypothetical protein
MEYEHLFRSGFEYSLDEEEFGSLSSTRKSNHAKELSPYSLRPNNELFYAEDGVIVREIALESSPSRSRRSSNGNKR